MFCQGGFENFFDLSYWGYFVYMVLVAYHAGERCSPLRIIRASLLCRKIASLFADLHLPGERGGGADFCAPIQLSYKAPLLRAFFTLICTLSAYAE